MTRAQARQTAGHPFLLAVAAGILVLLATRFIMDPIAISMGGVTFAAPGIYTFMVKSVTGTDVPSTVGFAVHWATFALLIPAVWHALSRNRHTSLRVMLAMLVPMVFWVILMAVLMPLMGLPFFYNFSLTTIWSGVAFLSLGCALSVVALMTRGAH